MIAFTAQRYARAAAIAAGALLASVLLGGVASAAERLYVSVAGTAMVAIYDLGTLRQIGSLSPGPSITALSVDAEGSLWVAGGPTVQAFRPGQTKPYITLRVPMSASGLAIADDGTVYVASGNNRLVVDVFAKGHTKATGRLAVPELFSATGLTLDARGTLYAVGASATDAGVSRVFSHAVGAAGFTQLPFVLLQPMGITGDAAGNLVIADVSDQGIYVLDRTGPEPVRVVGRTRQNGPTSVALSADERRLYAYDYLHAEVDVYDYATGDIIRKLPIPGGYDKLGSVAVSPRAPLGGTP